MAKGMIHIYSGDGKENLPIALGSALQAAIEGKRVVIIQFLKGRGTKDSEFLNRLEPEIKLFRFEKSEIDFESLPEEKKRDEVVNIRNGMNFAKKVLTTGECDLLILDEVLGLVEKGIIAISDLQTVLVCREETNVILTGVKFAEEICALGDRVSKVEHVKFQKG